MRYIRIGLATIICMLLVATLYIIGSFIDKEGDDYGH
jgi:hypothetical protein